MTTTTGQPTLWPTTPQQPPGAPAAFHDHQQPTSWGVCGLVQRYTQATPLSEPELRARLQHMVMQQSVAAHKQQHAFQGPAPQLVPPLPQSQGKGQALGQLAALHAHAHAAAARASAGSVGGQSHAPDATVVVSLPSGPKATKPSAAAPAQPQAAGRVPLQARPATAGPAAPPHAPGGKRPPLPKPIFNLLRAAMRAKLSPVKGGQAAGVPRAVAAPAAPAVPAAADDGVAAAAAEAAAAAAAAAEASSQEAQQNMEDVAEVLASLKHGPPAPPEAAAAAAAPPPAPPAAAATPAAAAAAGGEAMLPHPVTSAAAAAAAASEPAADEPAAPAPPAQAEAGPEEMAGLEGVAGPEIVAGLEEMAGPEGMAAPEEQPGTAAAAARSAAALDEQPHDALMPGPDDNNNNNTVPEAPSMADDGAAAALVPAEQATAAAAAAPVVRTSPGKKRRGRAAAGSVPDSKKQRVGSNLQADSSNAEKGEGGSRKVWSRPAKGSTSKQEVADLLNKVVEVPGYIFDVDVPDLYYRARVLGPDKQHAHAVVIRTLDDKTKWYFPTGQVREWWQETEARHAGAPPSTSPHTTSDRSDAFAAQVLAQLSHSHTTSASSHMPEPGHTSMECDGAHAGALSHIRGV